MAPMLFPLPSTAWVLLVANALPLVGVWAWGWRVESILWLYWLENLVVGVLTLVRMAFARGPWAAKAFLLPFFTLHFGLFCAVHGVFLGLIVAGRSMATPGDGLRRALALEPDLALPLAVLALAHLVAFLVHDVRSGRLAEADAALEMLRPYGRLLVLHGVVLLGAGLAVLVGTPLPALLILVVLKMGIELVLHLHGQRAVVRALSGPSA